MTGPELKQLRADLGEAIGKELTTSANRTGPRAGQNFSNGCATKFAAVLAKTK
jgi:hypothetical protein